MRFWQTLQIPDNGDPRALSAQLDIAALSIAATRPFAPFLSLSLAIAGSSLVGYFGHRDFVSVAIMPVLIILADLSAGLLYRRYQKDDAAHTDYSHAKRWFLMIMVSQIFYSACWGLMPWLLWEDGVTNHVFLAGAALAVIGGVMAARSGHPLILFWALLPVTVLTALRFVLSADTLDVVCAFAMLAFAVQVWVGRQPLIQHVAQAARLRFHVEDLAREIEETRDDALKKRFEAEAANASKTAFLANMSHELRTPLNAILGFSEIIGQECFGPVGNARYKEYAGDIHSSGAHLLSLINDLLDIAKIEAGRMDIAPHPLDPRRVFEIALKLIGNKAREKDQELVIDVEPATPALYADERALKQILINLVSNAVKFTPNGGRIDVLAGRASDGNFLITVRDNGPGIPRDKLDRIFTPFSQVDNRYDRQEGGTGLGLALVRGLAELHGGRAWLESEFGKGCSVFVSLPVTAPDAAYAAA